MASGVVVVVLTQPPPWRPTFSLRSLSLVSPSSSFHYRRSWSAAGYRRWDSNAETGRSQKFGFDFRGKKDDNEDEDEEYEEELYGSKGKKRRWWSDESPEMEEGPGGILEEAIDAFWILKVFKSYGWMLPIILVSWLVATGPKAFLMALALPLGQSALSLAFKKLWGRSQSRPKRRRTRVRKKQSARTVTDAETEEEEAAEEEDDGGESRRRKMGYQSWVVGNEGSVDKGGQNGTTFGGWDDLERAKSGVRPSRMRGGSGKTASEKGKLSRRERKSDTPLLLRLLIAFFPFLGSWSKMLW
ncbi:Transmembrane protein [Trema orientale]|uniref:Transmembrane protein n=1 Tax=Trema orientale TaxID=63057 RepID=A0A2P5FAS7_TREOI|nr:Transmembrane protein [Trema orientale]